MTSYNDFPTKGRERRQDRRNKAKRYKARDRYHGKIRDRDEAENVRLRDLPMRPTGAVHADNID